MQSWAAAITNAPRDDLPSCRRLNRGLEHRIEANSFIDRDVTRVAKAIMDRNVSGAHRIELVSKSIRPKRKPKARALIPAHGFLVAQVQHVSQLIEQISRATADQTSGISEVGDAVNQLDQVTQQNAALVEESAAAAESLRRQAAKLAEVVRVFQLA